MEVTINDVKFKEIPNKKKGIRISNIITQSNIGVYDDVVEYMKSDNFYALVNSVDIDWNGIEIDENLTLNTTSDLIKWIKSIGTERQTNSDKIDALEDTVGNLSDVASSGSYEDLKGKPDIENIAAGVVKNNQAQSDWNQSDSTKPDYIKNKPTLADAQIQADWSQTDTSKKDYIKNKPDLSQIGKDSIYIGDVEPNDVNVWIDPQNNSDLTPNSAEEIATLRRQVATLQQQMVEALKPVTYGVIPGDSNVSTRSLLINSAEPEQPEASELDVDDEPLIDDGTEKPESMEYTVRGVCCKIDTSLNLKKNEGYLGNGELFFDTDRKKLGVYYDNSFYYAGSGSGTGGSGGMSVDDLYNLNLEKLNFQSEDGKLFKATVDENGKVKLMQYSSNTTPVGTADGTWKVYVSQYLNINSVYVGGEDPNEECSCSHNFVELANGSDHDINLNGLYLLYTDLSKVDNDDVGYIWKYLPLDGIIKSGSTFVIRGARCCTDKQAFIQVKNYDMLWMDGDSPIKFKQGRVLFYLCVGTDFLSKLGNRTMGVPYNKEAAPVGYVDSCGFGEGSYGEDSSPLVVVDNNNQQLADWNKILFIRNFSLETAKQGNKANNARKTKNLWNYINLERQTTQLGNSKQYYWDDEQKIRQTPHASFEGKDFFTNKTHFKEHEPNYLNVLFGIQATDGGSSKRATRCFNWVSVGYFDEYLEYKKTTESTWTKVYSITADNYNNTPAINQFIEHYKRFRWTASDGTVVTTHKCIVGGLAAGTYEYRIGRDKDVHFNSPTLTFVVKSNSEVSNGFSFIQVTDQQSFNWHEYTAWWKTADCIKNNETNFDFLVNTGDITQSGNRASEWLDYYTGKIALRDKVEMFTVGNNDLCGHDSTALTDGNDATSKYSHINVLRYFCFELDTRNNYSFTWNNNNYPIYSLYSFNYGPIHFICLNSEIAIASSKMYVNWGSGNGDQTFAQTANAAIEAWLKKDLQLWKGNTSNDPSNCTDCVVYMHEMPFTMVTYDFLNKNNPESSDYKNPVARVGSHLNTLNSNGEYRFSRLFKKYGIKLVFGGHKHTYTISKPIYDAPAGYINSDHTINSSVDLLGSFTAADSVKPVIQVTNAGDIPAAGDAAHKFARYEIVQSINAPTYVMSQASGYKLVSNKEQPSEEAYPIPWLLSYFKQPTGTKTGTKENVEQHFPMYIRYNFNLSTHKVEIVAKQVQNIWNVNVPNNTASFSMNYQLYNIEPVSMTLSKVTEADKTAYNISNINSLTIDL